MVFIDWNHAWAVWKDGKMVKTYVRFGNANRGAEKIGGTVQFII